MDAHVLKPYGARDKRISDYVRVLSQASDAGYDSFGVPVKPGDIWRPTIDHWPNCGDDVGAVTPGRRDPQPLFYVRQAKPSQRHREDLPIRVVES